MGSVLWIQRKKDGELYHVYKRKEKEAVELKFVPYYTWANRGENEMMVWVPGLGTF